MQRWRQAAMSILTGSEQRQVHISLPPIRMPTHAFPGNSLTVIRVSTTVKGTRIENMLRTLHFITNHRVTAMKKLLFFLLFALSLPLFAQTAKIKIDVDRIVGAIDPKIYGVFMEPIHFNGRRMGLPDTVEFQHDLWKSLRSVLTAR